MYKEMVVRRELTEAMISAGESLTRRLDEGGWPVSASLWFFYRDGAKWKLILASPKVSEHGRRESYSEVREAISSLPESESHLGLHDVEVTEPDNSLIQLLSNAIGMGPGPSRLRLSHEAINGTLIEDALIYRLNLQAA